jgi:prepilin-type N-terminal cleavage/methylation domain-containing protein
MFIKPKKCIQSGVSLPEMMVGVAIGSLVFIMLASFSVFTVRSFAAMANYAALENESRNALDHMTMDIRQTFGLVGNSANEIDLEDAPDHQTLKFIYDPIAQKLTRWKNGNAIKLLDSCTALRFELFQRNTSNATYNQYPITTNAAECKVVQVTWKCQRSLFGSQLFNTEVVQTAKIVIRKK